MKALNSLETQWSVAWNSGGYARSAWGWTLGMSKNNASKMASELEKQGFYSVEVLPIWSVKAWCFWNKLLIDASRHEDIQQSIRLNLIALRCEKWLVVQSLKRQA